jgi:NADH-quinone oxidoreductase subunit I
MKDQIGDTRMYGLGILKSLRVVLTHFFETYLEDIRWRLKGKKRYYTAEGIQSRMSKDARGIFTVQYPEEKLPVPEEFRFIPFLLYEDKVGVRVERCSSCGIFAKVCPPHCIWIVRTNDPELADQFRNRRILYRHRYLHELRFCTEYCPADK